MQWVIESRLNIKLPAASELTYGEDPSLHLIAGIMDPVFMANVEKNLLIMDNSYMQNRSLRATMVILAKNNLENIIKKPTCEKVILRKT